MKAVVFRFRGAAVVSLSMLLALALTAGDAVGQAPASGSSKAPKKLTGRLPPYFGEVVSKEQRTKIYEIQSKYSEQLAKLREQIETLELQQQEEVHAVLTPDQRDQVAKRVADARAKRSKKEPEPAAGNGEAKQ